MKLQPHYSQSSRESATLSSGTIPLACYKEVPPPPVDLRSQFFAKGLTLFTTKRFDHVTSHSRPRFLHCKRWTPYPLAFQNMIGYRGFIAQLPRIVCLVHNSSHYTPALYNLHWLPVPNRIQFKILLPVHRALCLPKEASKFQGGWFLQFLNSQLVLDLWSRSRSAAN